MATSSRTTIDAVKWNRVELDTYVDILVEEVLKGNKTTCTFNKEGWTNIKTKMEELLSRPFTMKQLRNKMNKLRSEFSSFQRLLNTTGFGWDDSTKRAETSDPDIWDRLIQENPGWAKYRKNGLPQWKSLEVIFADSYATGVFACSNNDDNIVFGESDGDNLDTEVPQELDPEQDSRGVTDGANVQRNCQGAHRLDRTPSAIRKRGRSSDIAGIMNKMLEHSKARLELFTSSMITNTTPTPSPNSVSSAGYSISQCVTVLNQILDLSKELYVKVMNHMTNNADWRELFMSLDDDKKLWAIESLP